MQYYLVGKELKDESTHMRQIQIKNTCVYGNLTLPRFAGES